MLQLRGDLVGLLPSEIGSLVALEDLRIKGSERLRGGIPEEWGALTKLWIFEVGRLDLHYNRWLPADDNKHPLPPGMTSWEDLQYLHMGGMAVCSPQDPDFQHWKASIMSVGGLSQCLRRGADFYLSQEIQSLERAASLLEGDAALLRVFFNSERARGSDIIPAVRAYFHDSISGTVEVLTSEAGARRIPTHDPNYIEARGDLEASANLYVPAKFVRRGMRIGIAIDPHETLDLDRLGIPRRIPATGTLPLGVRAVPPMELTLIPVVFKGGWIKRGADSSYVEPDSTTIAIVEDVMAASGSHPLLRGIRTLLPAVTINVSQGPTLGIPVIPRKPTLEARHVLDAVRLHRITNSGTGYWMGIAPRLSDAVGIAYQGGWSSVSIPDTWTVAHEMGHSMGLGHAPGAPAPDRRYWRGKHDWGIDFETMALVGPHVPDVMSYSYAKGDPPVWISTYHWNKALHHRIDVEMNPGAQPDGLSPIIVDSEK